jgi:hypothetical protein
MVANAFLRDKNFAWRGCRHMKEYSQAALLVVGIGVIGAGFTLMFLHQSNEFEFQKSLLAVFRTDFHWRSIGTPYGGIAAVIVGAVMVAVAAITARFG